MYSYHESNKRAPYKLQQRTTAHNTVRNSTAPMDTPGWSDRTPHCVLLQRTITPNKLLFIPSVCDRAASIACLIIIASGSSHNTTFLPPYNRWKKFVGVVGTSRILVQSYSFTVANLKYTGYR